MPIYQYKCVECSHQFEALQKMNAPLLVDCPQCHKPGLRKQVTSAAFKLKGGGWYETDFKNSGAKPAAGKKPDAGSTDTAAGGAATESVDKAPDSASGAAERPASTKI